MSSRWRESTGTEINLAPLLDVIFCLLFFFIIATSIKRDREALDISLPKTAQTTEQIQEPRTAEVTITKENKIVFDGAEITGPELQRALRDIRKDVESVIIRTDGEANVQTLMTVSDACVAAGLRKAVMEAQRARPAETPTANQPTPPRGGTNVGP